MADEQLRLVASLKDNATPGVRRIKAELKGVDVAPGMAQAQKWVRGFNDDVAKFKRSSMTVASVMSAMGVGGLAAAGSIGTLAAAFKTLADRTLDMRELGREVGLAADEINAMNRAGQHFGFDPSQMEGAIRHFAGLMPEFKRGYGELNNILARQPDLIKRLRVEDTKTQIKEIFDFLGTIKNPQDRMVFERGIFGTDGVEKLFADGAGGFEAQAEKFRSTLAPITAQAAAQAQALRDAINDFNAAVDNLELKAGPTVYKWLTAGVTELGAVLDKVQKAPGDVAAAAAVIAGSLAALRVRNRIMRGSALAGGGELRAAAGQLSGAGAGLDKTALTLNEAAIALREAAVELRGRGAVPGGAPGSTKPSAEPGKPSTEPQKPGGTSFDNGRALLAAAGLAGVVVNAPGLDEAGDRERDANASALESFGESIRKILGVEWLQGKVDAWRAGVGTTPATVGLSGRGEDGNALHRNDEMPVARPSLFRTDDDRASRARASDMPDRSLDSFVVGSLDKPVMHLVGTLKTAAAQAERDGIKPAAFHPGAVIGGSPSLDPVETIAAGTKAGVLAALRELQSGMTADPSTARGGIIPASFGGGGGGGGNSALGGGFGGHGGSYGNPSKSLLDFIAQSEGGGYNVSWGNGKFLPGGHEQNLTGKTLNEILALGDTMRRQPGARNSSAMGRYQITGSTLRDLMKRMGLSGSEKYDEAMQDRMASKLISDEGPRALGRWEGLKRGDRMSRAMGLLKSGQIASQPEPPTGDVVGDALGKLRLARNVVGVQCVALANAAVGFGGSVREWRRGVNAADGTLKDGTPVATFLNRDGSQSDRYAGGGIGTEGANRDHAAIFRRYLRDAAGKAIGMTVSEQSRGHPLHLRNYMFGRGAGEQNGSNYNAIMGPDGKPLGGANNPMTELRAAAEQLRAAAGDQQQAARAVAKVPDWHDPSRPDLGVEKRRAEARLQQPAQVEGGIDAHVHLHDGRTTTRIERRGAVREAGITVRRAPQRTATV